MPGPILYSTNPWISHEIAIKYRNGIHFVWCSEYYDPASAPPGSAGALIAPSSSPKGIFETLQNDCDREDGHSHLIKGYRKTFQRLATNWLASALIDRDAYDEIVTTVRTQSWRIWRPQLYIIPRAPLDSAGRVFAVKRAVRAAYGPELQIIDLQTHEFDFIEGSLT